MKPTDIQIWEAADKYVFDEADHNRKWSNNDDTAGDNFGSFKAGANWAISQMQPEDIDVPQSENNPQEVPQVKSVEEQIKQSYGLDFDFFKPYIDFKNGIAKVPSKINRSNLDRRQFKIWIDIEAPSDCQFYECFKPYNLNIKAQPKTIERLLADLQDELHYQSYPSNNPVPIYKEKDLKDDYFPLHMVKTVCNRYTQSRIAELEDQLLDQRKINMNCRDKMDELEAKNKKYEEALEGIVRRCKNRDTVFASNVKSTAEKSLKPKGNG